MGADVTASDSDRVSWVSTVDGDEDQKPRGQMVGFSPPAPPPWKESSPPDPVNRGGAVCP